MEQKIKWIIFDLSGVLASLTFVKPEGYSVGSRFFNQIEVEDFFKTKDYQSYMLGTLSHEQCVSRFIKSKKMDLSVEEFNELLKNDMGPIPGMVPLLEKLLPLVKLAVGTNEGKEVTKLKIEGCGVLPYLSKVIASYRIRELKPSPAFYKKTAEILNVAENECIFVDDKQENVNGANAVGMKGILFKSAIELEKELSLLHLL